MTSQHTKVSVNPGSLKQQSEVLALQPSVNNILSEFNKGISGAPQGSISSIVLLVIFTTLLRMLMYITLKLATR